ncbi:MAG: Signal transduction histidine-protein kinase BarA [bacterium ADurb.Bin243]|nr:MAG: Signal transduction histidine-protein kinase BarA [bacterium ADurb.Bin243]
MSEKSIKILLIEDNPLDARAFNLMLSHAKSSFTFETSEASSLKEAIEMVLKQKFDVILLDLSLPDENGLSTLTKLLEHSKDVPIIVLTGIDDETLGINAVKAGAQNYLVKGQVNNKFLVRTICYATEKRYLSNEIEKKLQKELEISEERFKHIYNMSPVMMFSFDSEGNFCDVNSKWLAETGYSREEVIGKRFDFLIPPHHKRLTSAEVSPHFLKAGQIKDYFCQYIKKDGSLIEVLINCVLTAEPFGKKLGLAVVQNISEQCRMEVEILDMHEQLEKRVRERTADLAKANEELHREIAERKKAETALKHAKEYAELIYQVTPSAIFTVDKNCTITSWNDRAAELTGYSPKEAVGKKCFILCRDKCSAFNTSELENIEGSKTTESIIITKDGKLKTILKNRGILKDNEGRYIGFIESFEDITERKQNEDQLRKLSYAIEQCPVSIVITNIQGDIEYVNPKFTQMTGYSPDEVIGKNPRILKSGQMPVETYKQLWNAIISGHEWHGELNNRKKNGELYWEFASISPIKNKNDMVTHFLAVKEDITERKKAEFELQYAKVQADYANLAKSEFLANISHEIRTPLNGVIGFTDILMNTPLKDDQADYVKTIKNSSMILLKLINDILDFSKIESGKLELEEIDFDLELVCYEVCEMISFIVINKPIEILCNIDSEIFSYFKGDAVKIKQILINLLGNSSKFTEKGEISLLVNRLEESGDQVKLHFCVKDTGIGIDEDKLDIIFETFKQVDGSITRKYGGSGLGLSICKKLVNFMKGEIWVESRPHEGSAFHFTLWLKKPGAAHSADFSIDEKLRNKKILIVDDNEANIEILARVLKLSGFKAEGAASGEDALQMIAARNSQGSQYDLVVLDIQMPGMDGYETAKKIRKSEFESVKTLPILAFSTLFDKNIKKFIEAGFNGFLPKPIRRQKTLDTIIKLLNESAIKPGQAEENSGERAAETDEKTIQAEKARYPLKVMLVEDHPVNQKLVKIIISSAGYNVDIAENGEQAVELFKKSLNDERYNIIFMDIQMPVMDGLTATKKIRELELEFLKRQHEKIIMQIDSESIIGKKEREMIFNNIHNRPTPIIAMTANVVKGDREACINSGMNDYLAKPIKKEALFEMINKWLLEEND